MHLNRLFLSIALLAGLAAPAQKGSIEGLVADAESSTPVAGATINLGTAAGDQTDGFGRFVLAGIDPGQYEMIVSHVGYRTEIVPVDIQPNIRSALHIQLKKAGLDLSEVRINSKKGNSLQAIGQVDIRLRPIQSSQDVLRIVPGLFIAQHAGGGKAEQIFLRGYDIDHGTDIAITVDGMPVNMVSHAHGQGYADLHFLIPETVEKVHFDKGPYFAPKGNLATAAYVDFKTRDFLEENMLKAEAGVFNTQRLTGMLKLHDRKSENKRQQFYLASEYLSTDGYVESPQDFHRFNLMGKFNSWYGNQSQLTLTASTFDSRWNASGQIPVRAVQSGMISRFGAIDDTEGGHTSRSNISLRFHKQWKSGWKSTDHLYFSRYAFTLFSNFTFFLEDTVNGDMIRQQEKRNTWGYTSTAARSWLLGKHRATTETGAGFRHDGVMDIALSKATRNRFFRDLQKGDVKETNLFAWIQQELELGDRFNLTAALRYDHFRFRYRDELAGATDFSGRQQSVISPKLNISFNAGPNIKLYLQNGIGFHSNDSRVILGNQAEGLLPRVYGTDLGLVWKPYKNLILKSALWHLYAEQEFVYVGDAGIVEPGGKTRRMGIDLSARYQLTRWLFADADFNFTKARAIEAAKGQDYIPLAPLFTSIGGLTLKAKNGLNGSLRYRAIGNRPANEDNSVRAEGYLLLDAILGVRLRKWDLSITAENLLNRDWREAQFDTESRLRLETDPVSEIHFTPGTPRFIKAAISFYF